MNMTFEPGVLRRTLQRSSKALRIICGRLAPCQDGPARSQTPLAANSVNFPLLPRVFVSLGTLAPGGRERHNG